MLCSYVTQLDEFVAHLQAAAEGLESPEFIEYDGEEFYGPGVSGYRLRTPDEHTKGELLAREREARDRETYEALRRRYEPRAT